MPLEQCAMLNWTFTFLTLTKQTPPDRGREGQERAQKELLFPKEQPTERKRFLLPPPTRSGLRVYFCKGL